jgi:hypothetical protein
MEFKSFAGLRNDRPIERFGPADLTVGQNVDIDSSGGIARRSGYTQIASGAKHSLWSDDAGEIAFYVSDTVLYKLNSDLSVSAVKTGLTPDLKMVYHKVLDRVYFSNGQQSGVIENNVARSWGLSIPTLPTVSVTVGEMPEGVYQYTMTYFRNDGQESGATLAHQIIVPEGGGLTFTAPVSDDSTVTLKGIYLSTPNGEILYQIAIIPNDQALFVYAGNALEFTLPLATQFFSGPPAGHMIGSYRGHVYVAVDDTLYPSEPFAYELFDLRKGIPLDGRITLFSAMDSPDGEGLFIGTDRDCGIFVGKGPVDFEYVPKINYGAIEGTLVHMDGSLYGDGSFGTQTLPLWLTSQGICVGLPKMEIRNITRARYRITAEGQGSAVFLPEPNRLIMTSAL